MAEPQITMGFSTLESLLRPTINEYLQEHQPAGPSGGQGAFNADCVMGTLRKFLGDMKADDSAPASLAGIQMPEVDSELADVQAEVDEILQRLSKQRTNVPNAMAAAICQQLEALRPSTSPVEQMQVSDSTVLQGDAMAAAAASGAGADAGVQEALRLQQMLGDALNKLPALRAKLEQAEQRLVRNLAAVEADKHKASPKTVERVMMDKTNRGTRDGFQAEEAAGSGITKRMLARELAHV